MLLPAPLIALTAALAALAWALFARSQWGRLQGRGFIWFALPFLGVAAIYSYYSLFDVSIDIRAQHARYGLFGISFSQSIILLILYYFQRGTRGTRK